MSKCVVCGGEIPQKRKHWSTCSIACTEIKSASDKEGKERIVSEYVEDPKMCCMCGLPIPYTRRKYITCSVSCTVKSNYKAFLADEEKMAKYNEAPKVCAWCGGLVSYKRILHPYSPYSDTDTCSFDCAKKDRDRRVNDREWDLVADAAVADAREDRSI